MAKRPGKSELDTFLEGLRAQGKTEEQIQQAERSLRDLSQIALDITIQFSVEASGAHIQWLWDRTSEAGTRSIRAWRLRQRGQRTVCTVEHEPRGRTIRCVVAGVEAHVDVVETIDQMRRMLNTRFVALHEEGWKGRFTPRAWMRIIMRRKMAAYRMPHPEADIAGRQHERQRRTRCPRR